MKKLLLSFLLFNCAFIRSEILFMNFFCKLTSEITESLDPDNDYLAASIELQEINKKIKEERAKVEIELKKVRDSINEIYNKHNGQNSPQCWQEAEPFHNKNSALCNQLNQLHNGKQKEEIYKKLIKITQQILKERDADAVLAYTPIQYANGWIYGAAQVDPAYDISVEAFSRLNKEYLAHKGNHICATCGQDIN